jgi:hypothetical protein
MTLAPGVGLRISLDAFAVGAFMLRCPINTRPSPRRGYRARRGCCGGPRSINAHVIQSRHVRSCPSGPLLRPERVLDVQTRLGRPSPLPAP